LPARAFECADVRFELGRVFDVYEPARGDESEVD
jgi:hypothetical protein